MTRENDASRGNGCRVRMIRAAALGAVLCGMAGAAAAQEVVLRSNDGSATITGELMEFADGFYRLRTELGELRLSAARMVCEGAACPQLDTVEADLVFAGSDTIGQGIMPLLLAGWAYSIGGEAEVQNGSEPGTSIAELVADQGFGEPIGTYLVRSSTSDDAFTALEDGTAQVGMSARRILPAEARALRAAGAGNMVDVRQERILAVDPLTVIVHPSNPVDSLTLDELAAIYRGEIRSWAALGGPDRPIDVHVRESDSATRTFFDGRILGGAPVGADAEVIADNNAMAAAVNASPGAIGYVGFAFQRGAKPLSLVSACGLSATPSAFSSKTEEYPLDRRLYLYARADTLSADVERFFDFATSPGADGAIAKAGFVDLSVAREDLNAAADRVRAALAASGNAFERDQLEDLATEMDRWDRLSTTLRFATGSSELDERGRADVRRLIDYLEIQPAGTEIAIVGFTDSVGAAAFNQTLSEARAAQAASEVNAAGGSSMRNIAFSTRGFGELAPAACNDDANGRRINRRVEVWIRGPRTADTLSTLN